MIAVQQMEGEAVKCAQPLPHAAAQSAHTTEPRGPYRQRPVNLEPLPTDPTPEEIAAGTERIRAGWSPGETRRRAAWADAGAWTAPAVEFDDESAVGDQ